MSRRCPVPVIFLALVLCLPLLATGCRHALPTTMPVQEPEPVLEEVPVGQWPKLEDDLELASLLAACQQSLQYLEQVPADRSYRIGGGDGDSYSAGQLAAAMTSFMAIVQAETDPVARTAALGRRFRLLRSTGRDGQGEVLLTGYYEPLLEARETAEPPDFVYPVYAVPDDLVTIDLGDFGLDCRDRPLVARVEGNRVVPYPDREAIDFADAIADRATVLAYVSSIVDLFFLHVQGSGTLVFPSGERVRAGYATSNGHAYRSIGRLLLDEGRMTVDEMSMQSIKAFLAAHPEELRRVLSHNRSYVFFRALPPAGGPLGCYGLPLTAGRSIATDRRLFPAPVVTYVRGSLPDPDGGEAIPFARFTVNQDTGGAIRGPGRVDLFYGAGDEAGEQAGRTKHRGQLYLLLPRQAWNRRLPPVSNPQVIPDKL